jgi:hypothetical protein
VALAKCSYSRELPNPNEGETITRLELEDDGRFVYTRERRAYAASHIYEKIAGRWTRTEAALTLHVEESDIYDITPPATLTAMRRGNFYDFEDALVAPLVPVRDDPYLRRDFELEEQQFKRSLKIKPSKLVR